MNITRIVVIASAIFIGFLQLLLTIHHAVKIRLGDLQEGWSITYVAWLFFAPVLVAALIELARKIKD